MAPIQRKAIATDIFSRTLTNVVPGVTLEEVLSLSPEVRGMMQKAVTPKRVPRDEEERTDKHRAQVLSVLGNIYRQQYPDDKHIHADLFKKCANSTETNRSAWIEEVQDEDAPPNANLPPDPFATFNAAVPPVTVPADANNPRPNEIYVDAFRYSQNHGPEDTIETASVTHDLRCITAFVNRRHSVECVLDGGCQIVAMSEEVCHKLGLIYDPKISYLIQSANGESDRSLGLARNVPFEIANTIFYLQVHIIRDPAYDILLGRPFEVYTQAVLTNFPNATQTITILNPNTGTKATIPTYTRGSTTEDTEGRPVFRSLLR